MAKDNRELEPLDYFNRCFEDFPPEIVKVRKHRNEKLTYVEWYNYVSRGHKVFTPKGFSTEIRGIQAGGSFLYLIIRVINDNTGQYHDGLGLAPLDKDKAKGFGGAGPEAYSQGLRRAFAMHGMGLPFYMDEDEQIYATETEEDDEGEPGHEEDEAGHAERRTTARKAEESDDAEDEGEREGDDEAGHRGNGSRSRDAKGRGGEADGRKDARKPAAADADDGAEEDENPRGSITEEQGNRLNSLARIFEEGGLDTKLAQFRRKYERNATRQGASIVIREMKEWLEARNIDWRDEEEGEGKD